MLSRDNRLDEALSYKNENGLVVDGIRNMNDFLKFKDIGGLTVAFWCPFYTRLERAIEKSDPKDVLIVEGFRDAETPEYDDRSPLGQHYLQIMQMADYSVDAGNTKEKILESVEQIIQPT